MTAAARRPDSEARILAWESSFAYRGIPGPVATIGYRVVVGRPGAETVRADGPDRELGVPVTALLE